MQCRHCEAVEHYEIRSAIALARWDECSSCLERGRTVISDDRGFEIVARQDVESGTHWRRQETYERFAA
jgi:hypothetical protein